LARQQVKGDFELFATNGDFELLRAQLGQDTVVVPFNHAAGLGPKTDAILDQMLADLAAGAPHPIQTAYHRVIAVTDAVVRAEIDSGLVVVNR
jgi:hypothetical protein